MYKVFMLDLGYYLTFETDNLDEAMQKAVDSQCNSAVCDSHTIVKIYRTVGGWS